MRPKAEMLNDSWEIAENFTHNWDFKHRHPDPSDIPEYPSGNSFSDVVEGQVIAWSLSPIMAAMLQKTSWKRIQNKAIFFAIVTYAWTIMGSSKKHKEKDKDRDRERRREKDRKHRDKDRERDRDTEKEKSSRRREERSREKRSHGSEEDVDRVDKKKTKREDYDDLYEYAVEESARDDHENSKLY